ncbi:MAG TPA: DUF4168 domain-containing protein [Thermodesulfobacteriota bacterium]
MRTTRTAAAALAFALAASPAIAQQSGTSSTQSQTSRSGGQQDVSRQDLQKYVQALQSMSQVEPDIEQALQQGQPVDFSVLNRVPQDDAKKAIQQSGLSNDEFRFITEKLDQDPSVKQQFQQVARQQMQQGGSQSGSMSGSGGPQPGGSQPGGAQSGGAQPSSSPQ